MPTSVPLTVDTVPLTLTAPSASVQYSDALPALTAPTPSGLVNGDTLASLSGAATCTTTAGVSATGMVTAGSGSYPVNCTGLSSTDYTITAVPGSLTVAPEQAGVTLTSLTPVVDAPTASTPVTLSAKVTQQADGHAGWNNWAKIKFSVFKSSNMGVVPDYTASVFASGAAIATVTLSLPVDTYVVVARVDPASRYYTSAQSRPSIVTLVTPGATSSSASGGGTVSDPTGLGSFGFNIGHPLGGALTGTFLYTYRDLAGHDVIVKQVGWFFGTQTYSAGAVQFTGGATWIVIDPANGALISKTVGYHTQVNAVDGGPRPARHEVLAAGQSHPPAGPPGGNPGLSAGDPQRLDRRPPLALRP